MFYSFQYKDTMQVWLNAFLSVVFYFIFDVLMSDVWWGFPGGTNGKEPACQCRRLKRCRFHPWIRKIPWRRAWQPTPVFLPGKSYGQRSLVDYSPWSCIKSDFTTYWEAKFLRSWVLRWKMRVLFPEMYFMKTSLRVEKIIYWVEKIQQVF